MKLRLYLLSCMLPLLASCGTVTTPTTGSGTTGTSATGSGRNNAIVVDGPGSLTNIEEQLHWQENLTYLVQDSITILAGARLTIDAGRAVKLRFSNTVTVAGTLNAFGTQDEPIIITVYQDDTIGGDSDGLTKAKILTAFEALGAADVPDDGQRYAVIGWRQWSQLLDIPEFADADYVGDDDLPWKGAQAKQWLGTLWMAHSGLTLQNDVRLCHWYHKTAVGHASGQDVKSDITWHGDRAAHFVNSMMSQGATLIDEDGMLAIPALEP